MVTGELKRFIHIFATLGGVLIILNAVVALIMASFVGTITLGVVVIGALPAFSAVAVVVGFAIAGIVVGILVILEANDAIRETNGRDHWLRLIILGVIAFVVTSGFVIGAVLVFLAGFGGLMLDSGLNPFNLFHFGSRICSNCGYVASVNAKYCPSCGKNFFNGK